MNRVAKSCVVMAAVAASVLLLAGPAGADEVPRVVGAEIVGGPVTAVRVDVDIRDLPPAEEWRKGDPIKYIPRRFYPDPAVAESPYQALPDRLADLQISYNLESNRAFGTPIVNVAGQGNSGVSPPDTVGDVGPNHYIQAINHGNGSAVRVYDKNGAALAAAFYMDSLGSGSCTNGVGDPIILYDRQADRWFMQEFSDSGNYMCVYISQTANPVSGGWYHYAFAAPSFPDYPHFGVWHNAYVATSNEGNSPPMYAWDRANMLVGGTARAVQRFTTTGLAGFGFEALTPATLVGANAPPAGMPAILMRHYDDEAHDGGSANPSADKLQLFELSINWTTPASSTLTGPYNIATTEFNSKFIDYSTFYSVPTPGGGKLDPIREVILNRLQYTNFGDHQSLVGVLPTNLAAVSGTSVNAAQRWFEVRGSQGSWSLYQEGTMTSGSTTQNRFVGSIAMDQSGNIGLGYSITDTGSPAIYPSINYTGRLSSDPLNVMTQTETRAKTGAGNISGSDRWGDYSAMGLDPADDCTFWYTQMYWNSSAWATQISSFKFDACGCALSINPLAISAATNGDNVIRVSWTDSTTPQITEYRVYRSLTSGSGFALFDTVVDSSPGSSSGTPYAFDDTTVSGGVPYYYKVYASDGAACTSAASNEAWATATGSCALAPTFAGVAAVDNPGEATCALDLSWTAGASLCGNSLTYNVYRSTSAGFTPDDGSNLVASGVSGTSYRDADNVPYNTPVYYVVRAKDSGNGVSDTNLVEEGAIATGVISTSNWSDTLETYANLPAAVLAGWSHAAAAGTDDWALASGADHTTGTGKAFSAAQVSTVADKYMVSPEFGVITTTVLSFWHKFGFETGFDGGVLEISTNGGSSWADVGSLATTGAYNDDISTSYSNPLAGRVAWSGTLSTWTQVTVPLGTYDGQSVKIRWRMGTDTSSTGSAPWMIDDVAVANAGVAGVCTPGTVVAPIFSDGFEGGNYSAWSTSTP